YSTFYSHNNGAGEKLGAVDPNGLAALAFGDDALQALAVAQTLGPRATALDTPEISKEYSFRFVDVAQWYATDQLIRRHILSYTESKYLFRWDLDGSTLPLVASTTPWGWSSNIGAYSEELQFQGHSSDSNFVWTAGAFLQFIHPVGYAASQSIFFDAP